MRDLSASGKGVPDLITFWREMAFLEIKVEKKAQSTRAQIVFIAFTPAPVGFAQNEQQALEFAKNPREKGLTQTQKDKLALLLMREPTKRRFEFGQIKELLGL